MTTVDAQAIKLISLGTNRYSDKIGYFKGIAKAAQNDKIKIVNAKQIIAVVNLEIASTGVAEPHTFSGNEITCTSNTGSTTLNGVIIYR